MRRIFEFFGFIALVGVWVLPYYISDCYLCLGLFVFCTVIYLWTIVSWPMAHRTNDQGSGGILLEIFSLLFFILLVIILFAGGYKLASSLGDNIFYNLDGFKGEINSVTDYLYYSTVTATSLGFGDIVPKHNSVLVKYFTMLEILFGPLFIMAIFSLRNGHSPSPQETTGDTLSSQERSLLD